VNCQRVVKRLLRAEKLIGELLTAWDRSEMSNVVEALDKLRKFMSEI
jgi:flagellin-specific chaperone FliS